MVEKKLTGYPSIDKPWLKYYSSEDLKIRIPQCTVFQNIYDQNKDYPENVALLYLGNKIQYITLFSNVDICAKALRKIGVQAGDCVTLCTAGVPEAIYLVLACSRLGVIANFINPMFTKEQMIDRINESEAKWIFILDAMYSYIEAALSETCIENVVIIPVTNSVSPPLSQLLFLKSEAKKIIKNKNCKQNTMLWNDFCSFGNSFSGSIDEPYQPDIPTVMVYSSGSTGASKGILLTNDGINTTIANYYNSGIGFKRNDSFLQIIPVWFSTGIIMSLLMPLAHGMTVIPEPKFSNQNFVEDLIKYKPSVTLAATNMWLFAIEAEEMKGADLSNLKYPITGGEKVSPLDEKRINSFLKAHGSNHKLYIGYGMCELGSTISGTTNAAVGKPGGCGHPILNTVVSAFDYDTDEELTYGQHGELRVLSPTRMKEYFKNPEATSQFFKKDNKGFEWGCTGDIGYVDEDGEIFVLGRAKDNYRSENGKTVFLFDIESAILQNESVAQCKVIHFKDSSKAETVAHIVFQHNSTNEEEVLKHIHSQIGCLLPDYMLPTCYKIRKAMPVSANGKLDVRALNEDRDNLIPVQQLQHSI